MQKAAKPQQAASKTRAFYNLHPWQVTRRQDHSEIMAYVEASGSWEKVADICATSGADHETMSHFLLALIEEHQQKRDSLTAAIDALELVLNDGLTFTSEQAAERAVTVIKRVIQ